MVVGDQLNHLWHGVVSAVRQFLIYFSHFMHREDYGPSDYAHQTICRLNQSKGQNVNKVTIFSEIKFLFLITFPNLVTLPKVWFRWTGRLRPQIGTLLVDNGT